jgi:hypothetical protein
MPTLSAEVDGKLNDMVAGHLARIPAGDDVSGGHVERARRNAWVATMLKAKAEFEAATRGPFNRHDRRAAMVKGTEQHEVRMKAEMYRETNDHQRAERMKAEMYRETNEGTAP